MHCREPVGSELPACVACTLRNGATAVEQMYGCGIFEAVTTLDSGDRPGSGLHPGREQVDCVGGNYHLWCPVRSGHKTPLLGGRDLGAHPWVGLQ